MELKTFEYKDHVLWKTMHRVPRVLSGAGHGMAGIAEALYAAADVCGDDSYVAAANDALAYEIDAWHRYVDKFGTWVDLREFPPTKYMHGYCAGAPGTGIVFNRLVGMPGVDERVKTVAGLAHEAVERLPLNAYDHLCCGNSAIVEYYLSTGDTESAGRVLGALYERKQAMGSYRDAYSGPGGNVCASLFNGICGIGYEMLRYAFPERLESIL